MKLAYLASMEVLVFLFTLVFWLIVVGAGASTIEQLRAGRPAGFSEGNVTTWWESGLLYVVFSLAFGLGFRDRRVVKPILLSEGTTFAAIALVSWASLAFYYPGFVLTGENVMVIGTMFACYVLGNPATLLWCTGIVLIGTSFGFNVLFGVIDE